MLSEAPRDVRRSGGTLLLEGVFPAVPLLPLTGHGCCAPSGRECSPLASRRGCGSPWRGGLGSPCPLHRGRPLQGRSEARQPPGREPRRVRRATFRAPLPAWAPRAGGLGAGGAAGAGRGPDPRFSVPAGWGAAAGDERLAEVGEGKAARASPGWHKGPAVEPAVRCGAVRAAGGRAALPGALRSAPADN